MSGPLDALRDIHPPPPVPFWPPAPGWWLLAALALLTGLFLWLRHRRRRALLRAALAELEVLEARWRREGEGAALAADLSRLLRRVALACFPGERVAGRTGDAWLSFLDRTLGEADHPFTRGVGRVLAEAPYGGGGTVEGEPLLALARRWIRRVAGRGCGG